MDALLHMLESNQAELLKIKYNLLQLESNGLQTLITGISSYLRQAGITIFSDAKPDDAVICIQNLLDLKDKMDGLLINSFDDNSVIKVKMVDDYEAILNCNEMNSRYLSLFMDDGIKRYIKMEITKKELIILINNALNVHRYLWDKRFFEFYYKHDLSTRLLDDEFVSIDLEQEIVPILQNHCHRNFIFKLEAMLRDTQAFHQYSEEFKHYLMTSKPHDIDFELNVRVLKSRTWPIYSFGICCLPESLSNAYDMFNRFYADKYQYCNRKLTLHPQLGTVELDASFYGAKKRYFVQNAFLTAKDPVRKQVMTVSTYQMCVLMLFNDAKHITYEELKMKTGIPEKDLRLALEFLTFGNDTERVVKKLPDTDTIKMHHVFSVNELYTPKIARVRIKTNDRFSPKGPSVNALLDQDRVHEINLAIMNVMKREILIAHEVLKTEVCNILRARFLVNPNVVDKQIRHLLYCEYFHRSVTNRNLYKYGFVDEEI